MAEVLPLSESELGLLASLVRHQIRFLVVGLSAAALQGAPVVTEDIDLWFEDLSDPKLAAALEAICLTSSSAWTVWTISHRSGSVRWR